jgi:hypothetical protein
MKEREDFSLVLGGPLYRLLVRSRLAGDASEQMHRRVVVLTVVAWLPLLLLTLAAGTAWGDGESLTFLRDTEMQLRLLVALPLLIVAELFVHRRMLPVVRQFVNRELIAAPSHARFDAVVASALRLRNSVLVELLLLAIVYGVGVLVVWRGQAALYGNAWYGDGAGGELQPSAAGWWLGLVSLPLFQFLLLRWYFRIFVWARFLWQVSRLELNLLPTNPDRCGGLGFLSTVSAAFSPLLLAQGVMLAGMMSNRIFHAGATLTDFKVELVGTVAGFVFAIFGPMLVFAPKLAAAKRRGLGEYGTLGQRYAREFDRKWLRGGAQADEPLIGSADIQSLADLANAFAVVKEMRFAPFTWRTVTQMAIMTLLPVGPLLLTMMPLEEVLKRLLQVIF